MGQGRRTEGDAAPPPMCISSARRQTTAAPRRTLTRWERTVRHAGEHHDEVAGRSLCRVDEQRFVGPAAPGPLSDVPRPESVDEVARWEDPDRLGRTELVTHRCSGRSSPSPRSATWSRGTITDPGDGWTGDLFDDSASGNLWNFWLVWAAVALWLLIAAGVLVARLGQLSQVRADDQWLHQHGVPCSLHRSPYAADDGEGGSWTTFIAIDHRTPDEQAARIHRSLHDWLSHEQVQSKLDSGSLQEPGSSRRRSCSARRPRAGTSCASYPASAPRGIAGCSSPILATARGTRP
ncbi:hypothetical protein [Rhodococcus erythropolis]|uniref:hypothetical protein n=1 Tax=Rhodococcus erythropolis TaxID=1833 RepID=UPI0008BEA78D|nr:hypothetical protein [Rhodococcus erythropolis]OFV76952.1 hypothetical protein RERY_24030 [Rhodococcus erythropolis]